MGEIVDFTTLLLSLVRTDSQPVNSDNLTSEAENIKQSYYTLLWKYQMHFKKCNKTNSKHSINTTRYPHSYYTCLYF